MAQRAGRIMCPKCGANNFDTVTSCWKCGAPMSAGGAPVAQSPPVPQQATMMHAPAYAQERPGGYPQPAPMAYPAPAAPGDTGVARRAALYLGLTIPFIGLPVGWIFMMIEDRNKQAIGRWCAMWSMIGLVLHLLVTWFMIQQSVPFALRMLGPIMEGASRRSAGGGEGLPGGGALP